MRAILINPFARTIKEVDYNGNIDQIYQFIDAECFDVVSHRIGDIFVDDNGLCRGDTMFFHIQGYHQPLAGKALILGPEVEDQTTANTAPISLVSQLVSFG